MGELILQSIDGRTSVTDIPDHSQIVLPDRDWGGEFRVCWLKSWRREFGADDNLA